MSSKTINIIIITCLLASANIRADTEQQDFALQIHLPREITIKADTLDLGHVSVIWGEQSVVAKASGIALGRISTPGQKMVVDRSLILSRLACNGIPASKVTLTGAEEVLVKQQQQVIKGNELAETALSFLKKDPPDDSICEFVPMRTPKDVVIPGTGKDITLSARLVEGAISNQAKVRIGVFCAGREIEAREVTFRLKYNCHKVVTQVEIPRGAVIGPENVRIEKTVSNYPESANWTAPYGLVARRRLPANAVVRPNMVEPARPLVLLKRNQNVVIRVDKLGLFVTAIGKTMQDGRIGEYIKVRNVDSRRVILTKVNEDGTVEPVF